MNISVLNKIKTPAGFTFLMAALLVVSMTTSPFLLSISMWGLVVAAFWHSFTLEPRYGRPAGRWILSVLVASFGRYLRRPELYLFLLLLLVPALSGLWSDDRSIWLARVRVRLPFLVLPWAFANLPSLPERWYRLLLYGLVWMLVVLCLQIGINYLLHYQLILEGLQHGHPIPVPRNHIRFNLILATGILAGGWLWFQKFFIRFPGERPALAAAVIFLFFFIHFLSVRSGLAALYAALLFTVLRFIWRTRRWKLGLAALAVLALAPLIALKTLPSLQQRLAYMRWDWEQYQKNAGDDYSDAERWISFRAGMQLWHAHPLLGVGIGDLPAEMERVVSTEYPAYAKDPRLPHNQFIYLLAGTGLLGLVASLLALLYPVMTGRWRSFYLFAVFQVIIFTSFLVEYTLETAMGVAFYLFYSLWFMKMGEEKTHPTSTDEAQPA